MGGQPGALPHPPTGPTPLEMALTNFMNSIRGDQIQALIASGIFEQGQLMSLLEMAKVVQSQQDAQGQAQPQEEAAQEQKSA